MSTTVPTHYSHEPRNNITYTVSFHKIFFTYAHLALLLFHPTLSAAAAACATNLMTCLISLYCRRAANLHYFSTLLSRFNLVTFTKFEPIERFKLTQLFVYHVHDTDVTHCDDDGKWSPSLPRPPTKQTNEKSVFFSSLFFFFY